MAEWLKAADCKPALFQFESGYALQMKITMTYEELSIPPSLPIEYVSKHTLNYIARNLMQLGDEFCIVDNAGKEVDLHKIDHEEVYDKYVQYTIKKNRELANEQVPKSNT